MKTNLIWITPNAQEVISYCARVSNPKNQENYDTAPKLLRYLVREGHWSPFEMASACFEIETTRDIARQLLRHRSFSFQEFSQRYADVGSLPPAELRECRLQDHKNRQNSVPTDDKSLANWWYHAQLHANNVARESYELALSRGIAKEVARALLPEGLTPSRMYMSGTIRSWMHFCQVRCGNGTQLEAQAIASEISDRLNDLLPDCWSALRNE